MYDIWTLFWNVLLCFFHTFGFNSLLVHNPQVLKLFLDDITKGTQLTHAHTGSQNSCSDYSDKANEHVFTALKVCFPLWFLY